MGAVWRGDDGGDARALPAVVGQPGSQRDYGVLSAAAVPGGQLSAQPAVRKALEETIRTSHGGKIEADQLQAMLAIQQQRDRRMAERLLAAPTPALLIAGGYHAAKSVGVPLHVRDLQPAAAPMVLMLAEPGVQVDANTADYLWITPSVK